MGWKENQDAAIAKQKAAHAALDNGSDPVPASDEGGPLARYTRAQTLDYIAQLQNCLDAGAYLPTSDGPGLTFTIGQERGPLPDDVIDDYTAKVADLTAAGEYTADELAEAAGRLADNLEAGVSLDPATAESV